VTDLAILMRSGVVSQSSFKFIVGVDEWHIDSADNITRTILEIEALYDVCACAIAAYPQTDSEASRDGLAAIDDPAASGPSAEALAEADAARQRTLDEVDRRRRLASASATTTLRRAS
jgi:phage head maturation protease